MGDTIIELLGGATGIGAWTAGIEYAGALIGATVGIAKLPGRYVGGANTGDGAVAGATLAGTSCPIHGAGTGVSRGSVVYGGMWTTLSGDAAAATRRRGACCLSRPTKRRTATKPATPTTAPTVRPAIVGVIQFGSSKPRVRNAKKDMTARTGDTAPPHLSSSWEPASRRRDAPSDSKRIVFVGNYRIVGRLPGEAGPRLVVVDEPVVTTQERGELEVDAGLGGDSRSGQMPMSAEVDVETGARGRPPQPPPVPPPTRTSSSARSRATRAWEWRFEAI